MVESKTVMVDKAVQYNLNQYLEAVGSERQLSMVVNKSILTEEEDRYNIRREVGFLRKSIGYEEIDSVYSLDSYCRTSVNFHEDSLEYYDNPEERRRRGHMNKAEYLNACISSYISMMRAKRQMLKEVEVESWYYPQQEEKGLSWENVVWDDLKKTQDARVPVLVRVVKGEYQDEDVLSRKELVEKYQKESGQSRPTCVSHVTDAFEKVVNSSDWRESLRSQNMDDDYVYITNEDIAAEYYRNHQRVAGEVEKIIQRIKNHDPDDSLDYQQNDRQRAVKELKDLHLEIGKIFGSMEFEEQEEVVDDFTEFRSQIEQEQEKIANGAYPATRVF
jgi:hypothetical protein